MEENNNNKGRVNKLQKQSTSNFKGTAIGFGTK